MSKAKKHTAAMLIILDGNLEHVAHERSEIGLFEETNL